MELLKDKLTVTLDNLGKTERTKPLESANPLDAVLHEFNVAQTIRSYGEKRYDRAKAALKKTFDERLTAALKAAMGKVIKLKATQTTELADAEHHSLVAQVNPGSTFIDTEGLKLAFKTKLHLDHEVVDNMFKQYTKQREPTVTYIVANKLEERIQA